MELIHEIEEHIPPSISKKEAKEYCEKVGDDGTECITRMGGDAACYVRK